MQDGATKDLLSTIASSHITESLSHMHAHEHSLDPNAAWFALIGIIAKEWLYRITKRVADQEKSSVLLANAIHHRSDAYTSIVAFFAILGSWYAPWIPLDPMGGMLQSPLFYPYAYVFQGLLVSGVILQQGYSLLKVALRELMDAGVSEKTLVILHQALQPLISSGTSSDSVTNSQPDLLHITDLRAKRSGTNMLVDLTAHVPSNLPVSRASELEETIKATLAAKRSEINEVRVKFIPIDLK
jgi:divalent metal cation (Fe/Co/Zn/Cd) transporter